MGLYNQSGQSPAHGLISTDIFHLDRRSVGKVRVWFSESEQEC